MRRVSARSMSVVLVASFAIVSARQVAASSPVYMRRDAQGVTHFSTVPRPGWELFDRGPAEATPGRAGDERQYRPIIRQYAAQYRVEPALVTAMIRAESAFDTHAVSPRGARGLMQLTPRTARRHGVSNVHDPIQNIRGGVGHLRRLLDQFHDDVPLAIAAYNAGERSVARYGGLPPYRETRRYVARVLRLRREYLRQERAELARAS
jgi:soluble lytic murein transglycosylase-like protein